MKLFSSCLFSPRIARAAAGVVLAVSLPFSVFGALVWEKEKQQFQTEFGQESVEAVYEFTNAGDQTVTITSAKASCGCTVPSLEKKVYEPGESGELTAIFTIGSRQGQQHKTITVETESGDESQQYQLELEVDIPVPVTLSPRVRFWSVADDAQTQSIEVTFNEGFPMTLEDLKRKNESDPEVFDYEIETLAEGLHYRLKITPKQPHKKTRDVFYLVSKDDTKDLLENYPIYAYVR